MINSPKYLGSKKETALTFALANPEKGAPADENGRWRRVKSIHFYITGNLATVGRWETLADSFGITEHWTSGNLVSRDEAREAYRSYLALGFIAV
jgi:hypothetical protein